MATTAFQPGNLILQSLPFVYTLNSSERGIRCDFCFMLASDSNLTLKKCSGCKTAYFCNVICQRGAWTSFHKAECCNLAAILPENSPTETFVFYSRLANKIQSNEPTATETVCGVTRSFSDLEDHVEQLKNDNLRREQFFTLNRFLKDFFPNLKHDVETLWSAFGKMVINSYTVCDSEGRAIGTGLYLGASIFNHSCDPNAVAVFEGTNIFIRAIKTIESSDPDGIFITYLDPLESILERQTYLSDQYYFTCSCASCLDENLDCEKVEIESGEKFSVILKDSILFYKDISAKRCLMHKPEKELALLRCKELLLLQEGVLGRGHVYRIRLLDLAFDLCMDLELWSEVLSYALPTVEFYKKYYNAYHPNVGIQLYKIGKIHHYLENLPEAECFLKGAKNLLSISYGSDHKIVNELSLLLYQCQAELYSSQGSSHNSIIAARH